VTLDTVIAILLIAVPVVFAITLHEAAHGYAALALGDDTARKAGRLSLNPLKHVDRFGTIILPGFLLISQLLTLGHIAFMFGWAKPVPVDPFKFKNPRKGMMLVAAAGPLANFVLAWIGALAIWALPLLPTAYAAKLGSQAIVAFMIANVILGTFNLLPLPPLDGGRIAVGLLPMPLGRRWARLERSGLLIVILLLFVVPMLTRSAGFEFNPLMAWFDWVGDPIIRFVLRMAGSPMPASASLGDD
jgi:Zn-dependent protease